MSPTARFPKDFRTSLRYLMQDSGNKEGDIMTDLTLDEYKGLSKEELERILKKQAWTICGPDSLENNPGDTAKPISNGAANGKDRRFSEKNP